MSGSKLQLKIWLDLMYPDNKVKDISLHMAPPLRTIIDHLDFEMQKGGNNDMKINVILKTKRGETIL